MDKSQIEKIIKKAEAEARITKPPIGSLSSKRSAFLNKGRSGGGGGGGVIDCSLFRGGSGCWISTDPVNSGVTTQLMDQATKINTILNAGIQTPVSGGVGANFLGTSAKSRTIDVIEMCLDTFVIKNVIAFKYLGGLH